MKCATLCTGTICSRRKSAVRLPPFFALSCCRFLFCSVCFGLSCRRFGALMQPQGTSSPTCSPSSCHGPYLSSCACGIFSRQIAKTSIVVLDLLIPRRYAGNTIQIFMTWTTLVVQIALNFLVSHVIAHLLSHHLSIALNPALHVPVGLFIYCCNPAASPPPPPPPPPPLSLPATPSSPSTSPPPPTQSSQTAISELSETAAA
jgi:hypothetical protein